VDTIIIGKEKFLKTHMLCFRVDKDTYNKVKKIAKDTDKRKDTVCRQIFIHAMKFVKVK